MAIQIQQNIIQFQITIDDFAFMQKEQGQGNLNGIETKMEDYSQLKPKKFQKLSYIHCHRLLEATIFLQLIQQITTLAVFQNKE